LSNVLEIESAISKLSNVEQREVLLFVAASLRRDGALPQPRDFDLAEMTSWMDEDESDMRRLDKNN
jgi:hypothetical protein